MLVLTRKVGQEIVIGEDVRITVTKVAGNRVTLGIHAPDDVRIMRGELEAVVTSFDDPAPAPASRSNPLGERIALMQQPANDALPFAEVAVQAQ